ncbi:alpha/beta hydrolase [Ramlibacter henchirensis]|uniref:Alpha/beta hydrolase n=1 Tax=Ramlibacter henchirensis TaxID=204072 RepID=A0A4Z0BX83_9BURK|nr:alpha/beta hydrolase [Ramlibacter henchirensis]TFZ02589.1 alpha/beta hydrolase [Ramlibacter henchirensis]
MPHANMEHWRSLVTGQLAEYKPITSIEDLVARRKKGAGLYARLNVDLPDLAQFHEHVVMRPKGRSTPTAEIYVPHGKGPFPVLIHLHGGGWFTGTAEGERKLGMLLATAGFVVVNVDYALAPEQPYPQGLEDCIYAARWVSRHIAEYNGDPSRIAIGGGSAGGNLAACTVLALHGSEEDLDGGDLAGVPVRFAAAVLEFGVLDVPLWLQQPHYYAGVSEMFIMSYLGMNFTDKIRLPLVSPVHNPHLGKMCPTYLSCGDQDALLSHTFSMAHALSLVDVPITVSVVQGADHEFLKIPGVVEGSGPERERIAAWLHKQMGTAR